MLRCIKQGTCFSNMSGYLLKVLSKNLVSVATENYISRHIMLSSSYKSLLLMLTRTPTHPSTKCGHMTIACGTKIRILSAMGRRVVRRRSRRNTRNAEVSEKNTYEAAATRMYLCKQKTMGLLHYLLGGGGGR